MSEPTLTAIAKRFRIHWVRESESDQHGWVADHVVLCDAVIESEIRREEFEWLKEFETRVRKANAEGSDISCVGQIFAACNWLDKKRSDREGPHMIGEGGRVA